MEFIAITCPACWQSLEIESPTFSDQPIMTTTDCEVCCRPMVVTVEYVDPNDDPMVSVEPES